MTQKQLVNAYSTLTRLGSTRLPVKIAYDLYKLRKQLEPVYAFRLEQENAIIERHGGVIKEGRIVFENPDIAQAAQAEFETLNAMEMDINTETVSVRIDDLSGATLFMDEIEALDGLVSFC